MEPELYCRSFSLTSRSHYKTTFLYQHPGHLQLQASSGWIVFEGLVKRKVVLRISFLIDDQAIAYSPYRAPFGGIEILGKITSNMITKFVSFFEETLLKKNAKQIQIGFYSSLYQPMFGAIEEALLSMDYQSKSAVDSMIIVDEVPLEKKMKISERQKLRKSKAQFDFKRLTRKMLKSVYDFILKCREERNQSLSLSYAQLEKIVTRFPNHFYAFSVGTSAETAAAAIVIKVNKEVIYTFYYGHQSKYNKISPVVMLIEGIYHFAKQNNFKLIDLGTSMLNGKVNQPLLHFKKSIGSVTDRKLTFVKALQ